MIDCHCHILPGIDDGARDLPYALMMARKATGSGTTAIIATPHHLNGVYSNPSSLILEAVSTLRSALAAENILLDLFPGSELHLVPELPVALFEGTAMTYANRGKAALVELPVHSIPRGAEQILETLLYRGITPVIAHPERNTVFRSDFDLVGSWVEEGCKLQLTAQSCAGDFGRNIQGASREWCRRGWVHLLASDAHRTERRAPDLRAGAAAVQRWVGKGAVRSMTLENPKRLLAGEGLIDIEIIPSPKKRWLFRSS